ncbi:hypothetical protein [Providencia rettgeri]|uniref:phage tail fiber protein n=1 Tax=Providencia rettgeri TaxID=587 RepID=UPI0025520202|nr:hypothetical protein [Providencia rettgeri]MDK7743463.1 hypothetical protein [Providencia rettgeri]MDK7756305.1 hypothetical protein [Providencia rettgeri]
MYNTGTVTTTANSTKLVGTGTKWLNNINRVSAEQAIQIQIGTTVHNNSIQSIQSDTELTLNFPLPAAATGAKYVILTTMVHSVSDAMNKIVSMNVSNVQFSDILTRWMTEQGIITVTLPDQTTQQLRTTKEMDKQLDGKFDKSGGKISGPTSFSSNDNFPKINLEGVGGESTSIQANVTDASYMLTFVNRDKVGVAKSTIRIPNTTGTAMLVGDFGFGAGRKSNATDSITIKNFNDADRTAVYKSDDLTENARFTYSPMLNMTRRGGADGTGFCSQIQVDSHTGILSSRGGTSGGRFSGWMDAYSPANTTKDSNGNLKAASPIIKIFADHIELNGESEGVEMEHLGVGHYLIKGVVGFNADGAWGINNGFVIPQDHNGKNMALIDYEVRPDGDIEVFVFHQQNTDMPERFQNKRIKHFDEEGVPVYFENHEPCDVPESRWIDMRVEMPPNSLYNQKQAEAERLAKIEAERLAQEEAKRAAEEAERAEQESFEGGNNSPL